MCTRACWAGGLPMNAAASKPLRCIVNSPLSGAERAELLRLRKQVAEQDKDIAFLKKASAYFAAMQQNRPGSS